MKTQGRHPRKEEASWNQNRSMSVLFLDILVEADASLRVYCGESELDNQSNTNDLLFSTLLGQSHSDLNLQNKIGNSIQKQ